MVSKRCICGLSKMFPICDGSHRSEGWSCRVESGVRASQCFVAGPHHHNLAERLAAELGGVAAHAQRGPLVAERLLVLTDGTDLDGVLAAVARVEAPVRALLALNVAPELLAGVFPQWPARRIDAEGMELWSATCAAVRVVGEEQPPHSRVLTPAFISHAVADEHTIHSPLDYLRRRYQADLFLCADSIGSGKIWHAEINEQLQQRERVVVLLSAAAAASTFCAFEVGYALALGKALSLISLDGSLPPAYIQHLHMLDLPRRRALRPWLSHEDTLVDALLEVLSQ